MEFLLIGLQLLAKITTAHSSVVTLSRPPYQSLISLRITSSLELLVLFRQHCINHSADDVTLSNSSFTFSPLSPSITHSLFHSRLKLTFSTNLFHHSLLAPTWTAFSDYTGCCSTVFIFWYFSFLFILGRAVH